MVRFNGLVLLGISVVSFATYVVAKEDPVIACATACSKKVVSKIVKTCTGLSDLHCVCRDKTLQADMARCARTECPRLYRDVIKPGCTSCKDINTLAVCLPVLSEPKPQHEHQSVVHHKHEHGHASNNSTSSGGSTQGQRMTSKQRSLFKSIRKREDIGYGAICRGDRPVGSKPGHPGQEDDEKYDIDRRSLASDQLGPVRNAKRACRKVGNKSSH